MTAKRTYLGVSVGAVITLALVLVWVSWLRPPTAADLRSVSEQFEPPVEWVLEKQTVRSRSPLCIDVSCPSVTTRWTTRGPVLTESLTAIVRRAGWTLEKVDGQCEMPGGCEIVSQANDRSAILQVTGPTGRGGQYSVSLSVEE